MYKVKINDDSTGDSFETTLPTIPRETDLIGFWVNSQWRIADVTSIIHELNEDGSYLITEINVHYES